MGLFDFLKKKIPVGTTTLSRAQNPQTQELSFADKERITVERVVIEDMQKLTSLPYVWNSNIKKFIVPNGHPFAYMDLFGPNIDIAKQALEQINALISATAKVSSGVPNRITIPIEKIVFSPQKYHGYTRLICTPYTFTGESSKYPASLSFMTDLSNNSVSTHGDIFYGHDGEIKKASIFCWRKNGGFAFYCTTVDGVLVLEKVEHDGDQIYKAPHILALETKKAQEVKDFAWIQEYLPDKCPKNITGFRRMKTQNTKNYQLLKQLAAEMGREI